MRVFKNLLGDGSKIHATEVAIGFQGERCTLNDMFKARHLLNPPYFEHSSRSEFDSFIDTYDNTMPAHSFYWLVENPRVSFGDPFGGNAWFFEGYKAGPSGGGYGWQRGSTYTSSGLKMVTRAKYAGKWSSWKVSFP